jgi:hypothetical protein
MLGNLCPSGERELENYYFLMNFLTQLACQCSFGDTKVMYLPLKRGQHVNTNGHLKFFNLNGS